jgi:uroporphyrinogen-III synthase
MKVIFLIDKGDRYASTLPGSSWISLFTTHFVNKDTLSDLLKEPRHSTLIVSSKRSAQAIILAAANSSTTPLPTTTTTTLYTVGFSSQIVLDGLPTLGNTKNSTELAEIIINDYNHGEITNEIVLLTGDKRMDSIPSALRGAGIAFREVQVYRTERDRAGMAAVMKAVREEAAILLVLFSPSGVEYVMEAFKDVKEDWRGYVHFASIGQTSSAAFKTHGIDVVAEAESPDPESMALAITSFALK